MATRKTSSKEPSLMISIRSCKTLARYTAMALLRRIEQTSGDLLAVNYGYTLPRSLKLEQEGCRFRMGRLGHNRKARWLATDARRKQLERETRDWAQTTAILARFLTSKEHPHEPSPRLSFCASATCFAKSS